MLLFVFKKCLIFFRIIIKNQEFIIDLDLENFGKKKKKKPVVIIDEQDGGSGDEEKVALKTFS